MLATEFISLLESFCQGSISREEFIEKSKACKAKFSYDALFNNEKPVIWLLADALAKGAPDIYMFFWEKFKDNLPLDSFLTPISEGPDQGISALWLLAYGSLDAPDAFLAFWKRHKNQISLKDLLAEPAYSEKGIFALWSLAVAAAEGKKEPFLVVWEHFKFKLTAQILTRKVEAEGKENSILELLSIAHKNNSITFSCFENILKQVPNLSSSVLNELKAGLTSKSKKLIDLIEARIALTSALADGNVGPSNLEELSLLGAAAQKKGYINANFELSTFYRSRSQFENSYQFGSKISSDSWYYKKIQIDNANHCFSHARNNLNGTARDMFLQKTLHHAMEIVDKDILIKFIKKVASIYVLNKDVEQDVMPADLLEMIVLNRDFRCCWNRLVELKERKTMQNTIKWLKNELDEKSSYIDLLEMDEVRPLLSIYQNTVTGFSKPESIPVYNYAFNL